jgi:hypothetical protein
MEQPIKERGHRGGEAVILAGTELPLILTDPVASAIPAMAGTLPRNRSSWRLTLHGGQLALFEATRCG